MNNAKILIIDDDPDLRRALILRLQANDYETLHAVDGHSAISIAERERPKLIILDLALRGGDGFSVLERLQRSDALSMIPVIALTVRDPQFHDAEALRGGLTTFFQKPVDNNRLLEMIGAALPATSPPRNTGS